MKQKRLVLVITVVLLIIAIIFSWWIIATNRTSPADRQHDITSNEQPAKGQRICPDAWYDNQMAGSPDESKNSQYFIVNGQRVEFDELDAEWIKANCAIKEPLIVE